MTLYWLLSVPAHGDGHVAWRDIKSRIGSSDLYDFSLPTFKIGTLDGLVRLSDDLAKFDTTYETTLTKFTDTLRSLNPAITASQLQAQLTVDGGKSVDQYLRTFTWDNAKYRVDRPLVEILGQVAEQMGQVDGQLKTKLTQYNAIKGSLATVRRKQHGNLSVRALGDIVRPEHCVRDSEYLQTLFVAVPRSLSSEWLNTYERLTAMVVPRSTAPIAEDSEYILYSVVVFKRSADEFTTRARDARFTVRDFVYDEQALERERRMQMEVVEQETELLGNLSEWLAGCFGDVVVAWVHVKAMRVFVESVLRYGIPPDFLPVLVKPGKQADRIKRQLVDFYAYLETSTRASDRARKSGKSSSSANAAAADGAFDMHEFSSILSNEYTPFVFFEIPWTFFGQE
ncbi:Vacuolar ATP synthase subunit C [Kickxella alabastrina]|uniref:Vacuolar ATP synthase subunit C n=1 Tax=Kickxella alabastrina TaxID=61397 RepID=A0ACC1IAV0_9FUNG|nr:Vacuolar ATP synthase subunit C [Kickxella alabastrina]